jgi:hypothetical protein
MAYDKNRHNLARGRMFLSKSALHMLTSEGAKSEVLFPGYYLARSPILSCPSIDKIGARGRVPIGKKRIFDSLWPRANARLHFVRRRRRLLRSSAEKSCCSKLEKGRTQNLEINWTREKHFPLAAGRVSECNAALRRPRNELDPKWV